MSDEAQIEANAEPEIVISEPDTEETGPGASNEETSDTTTVFRVMTVESVVFDLGDSSPQVHLMENEAPYRHLSVPIALAEAQSLWAALNRVTGRRPSTHELTTAILRRMQADIIAVRVLKVENGVFYATLDLMTPRGREEFDCRTSDGFILALRQTVVAPILCAEEVLANFYL
ncbi:MAG: bifunctional nuclease family protein [Acidimicrobiales bacterium]